MMKYDLEKTFGFVKNDSEWIKKLLTGSALIIAALLLFFIPIIFVVVTKQFREALGVAVFCWVIAAVIGLGISGFCLQTAHDYIENPQTKLPMWGNFKSLAFIGFKSMLGSILFYLPVIFVGLMSGVLEVYTKGNVHHSDALKAASFGMNVFYQIVYLFYMFIIILFNANFIKEFNMFDYLNYAKAYKLIKGNVLNYVVLVLIMFALGMLFNISAIFLCLTVVGVLFIPFGAIYIQIIASVLIARFVQITREPKNETAQ